MQTITAETRNKIREIRAEIRDIDNAVQLHYAHIAEYESMANPKYHDMYAQDIAMHESDAQRLLQRRMKLSLALRKADRNMQVSRQTISSR